MSAVSLGKSLKKIAGENDTIQNVTLWLDTGFKPLNKAISGSFSKGFPVGRIVEMFGPESSGKTLIATKAMINAQQMGGIAMFRDHEHSFDANLAEKLGLLIGDEDPWIFKSGGTFESSISETIDIAQKIRADKLIEPDAPIIVVFDSLASMNPKSKMSKGVDEQSMHDKLALASATSTVFPVLVEHAQNLNMLILFLNQVRMKPGVMFGDPTTTPGGEAPKFYASVRIQLGRSQIKKSGSPDVLGQEITAKCIKNKVSAPFKNAKWRYMFNEDGSGHFDVVGSTLDYLKDQKLIDMTGDRFNWDGKTYNRGQLVNKIEDEGTLDQLEALLPPEE
jgi:protein RecA